MTRNSYGEESSPRPSKTYADPGNKPSTNLVSPALAVQVGGGHYKKMVIQPVEFCEANNLGACESAIVKYISRWRSKDGVQDLEKIKHYVDLLIDLNEKYPRNEPQHPPRL